MAESVPNAMVYAPETILAALKPNRSATSRTCVAWGDAVYDQVVRTDGVIIAMLPSRTARLGMPSLIDFEQSWTKPFWCCWPSQTEGQNRDNMACRETD
jgi:hypothetical protein